MTLPKSSGCRSASRRSARETVVSQRRGRGLRVPNFTACGRRAGKAELLIGDAASVLVDGERDAVVDAGVKVCILSWGFMGGGLKGGHAHGRDACAILGWVQIGSQLSGSGFAGDGGSISPESQAGRLCRLAALISTRMSGHARTISSSTAGGAEETEAQSLSQCARRYSRMLSPGMRQAAASRSTRSAAVPGKGRASGDPAPDGGVNRGATVRGLDAGGGGVSSRVSSHWRMAARSHDSGMRVWWVEVMGVGVVEWWWEGSD